MNAMRFQNLLQYGLALGVAIAVSGLRTLPVKAQMAQQELDQNGVVLVASPYQNGEQHQLLIIEQLSSARACWGEQKMNNMTLINPLLSEFDFSGICGRATDSNGFSVRMGGQDLNWRYALQVVEKDNQLWLMARSTSARKSMPDLLVGRVGGTTPSFAKIVLEPGWRVTRRIAEGKLTGHFYLTHDRSLEQVVAALQGNSTNANPTPEQTSTVTTTFIPPVSTPNMAPPAVTESTPAAVPPAPPTR